MCSDLHPIIYIQLAFNLGVAVKTAHKGRPTLQFCVSVGMCLDVIPDVFPTRFANLETFLMPEVSEMLHNVW